MRRWARRPSEKNGTAHRQLESFYFKLLSKVEKGKLETRPRSTPHSDLELGSFTEGRMRQLFIKHRSREYKLRDAKVTAVIQKTGALRCEVPRCGFDFGETYGEIGDGYIHVHHKNLLSKAASKGIKTSIDDLAVVCANCHAMIHRHGKSRPLHELRIRRKKRNGH
jgi:predicted HNH restriction endonuclease